MKKRLLSLALALCLSLGLAVPALALDYGEEYTGYDSAVSQQYRDVPEDHWAFQSIATCSQRTWFNGYPDGTFRPTSLITREEAAKVFAVAMGLEIEKDPEVTYTDTADNWARAYIEATKPLFPNVANLQGTASFRPTQTITREETIYALVVAWGYGSQATNADLSVLNMFSDTNSISVGVKPYMAVAVSEGLVSGLPDGTIAAQKGLTRAEFATLLARALSHGYGDTKQEFQAPKLTVDRYDAITTEKTLTVTGKVTPAENVTVALDGDDLAVSSDGSFSVTLALDLGNNAFTLVAENAYGVKDSKTIQITRQEEAVTIRVLSTVPEETEQAAVEVNGKVENWSDSCVLLLDNSRVSVDSDGYFQTTLQLAEGRNTFTFTVTKGQKEVGTATLQITRATGQSTIESSAESAEDSASAGGPARDTGKTVDEKHVALVLDAAWGNNRKGQPTMEVELLFFDATTEVVLVSKLNGKYIVSANAADDQVIGGPPQEGENFTHTGYNDQAIAQLANTKIGTLHPAFYHYRVDANGRYELTKMDAKNGWADTEYYYDASVWPKSDFTQGGVYTADSGTIFLVDQEGADYFQYHTYVGFENLPVMGHVSGVAVGAADDPGVAQFVFLSANA